MGSVFEKFMPEQSKTRNNSVINKKLRFNGELCYLISSSLMPYLSIFRFKNLGHFPVPAINTG